MVIMTIETRFQEKCSTPSDIFQHLPTLQRYASECRTVTEMGVRGIVSTWALLAGHPEHMLSVDYIHPVESGGDLNEVEVLALNAGIDFHFVKADSRAIVIAPTDLLFIDTWHVEQQLKAELEAHADKVQKYIILHDTETFGERGENEGHRGLNYALNEFLTGPNGSQWEVKEHFKNCNGLTVLARRNSKVKVFCFFYNEAALIPHFLYHYRFADIHAFVSKSTDDTRRLLSKARNVTIEDFEFPSGFDDQIKSRHLNAALALPDNHDWHIVVDSDEFIWPLLDPLALSVPFYLSTVPASQKSLMARMKHVYRHVSEQDLVANCPVALQRRHGSAGIGGDNAPYQKVIVFRANQGFRLTLGNHALAGDIKLSDTHEFTGAHWQNADPSFCITRRVRDRGRHRQSSDNLALGLGAQNHNVTEEGMLHLLESHKNDPEIF